MAAGFAEAVLPKAKCESWWAIVCDKNHWPHINGAHAAPVLTHNFNARTGPDKGTVAKTARKNLHLFFMPCRVRNPISTRSYAVLTRLGSLASELDQPCVQRLRPAVAFWPFGSRACIHAKDRKLPPRQKSSAAVTLTRQHSIWMPCMPAVPLEFGHYLTSFILQHTQFLDRGQIKSHRHVPRGLPKMETVEPISPPQLRYPRDLSS